MQIDIQRSRTIYHHPKYYELAFSFRDIPREVDVIEECIKRYSCIPARRMLELGCGPAPHIQELCRRGYEYIGLDLSEQMLSYARKKVLSALSPTPTLIRADMCKFELPQRVDFAFILLGSLYVRNAVEVSNHFASVAEAMNPGGLYLLDWCLQFEPLEEKSSTWTLEKDGLVVEASYSVRDIDTASQTYEEVIRVKVRSGDELKADLEQRGTRRAIYPEEFLEMIQRVGQFEFIGWWNNWNLREPLQAQPEKSLKIERPITLIRKM